jgi:hypothetical protein
MKAPFASGRFSRAYPSCVRVRRAHASTAKTVAHSAHPPGTVRCRPPPKSLTPGKRGELHVQRQTVGRRAPPQYAESALISQATISFMRNKILAVAIALCALLVVLYAGDYAVLRLRIALHGTNSVVSSVTFFYAAPLNGGKVSVFYDQPQNQPCTRSLFPQLGNAPCWYLQHRTVRVVD